ISKLTSPMEAITLSDNYNKENIPPFSPKQANPVPVNAPSFKKIPTCKRRFRKPLADITNLFNNSVSSSSTQESISLLLSSPPVSVCAPNARKRKAVGSSSSKSLRMGFR
ncbi:hypothetical protein CFOL_v3_19465, partial [Cephalotus follicularis]